MPTAAHRHDYCDANECMAQAWYECYDEHPDVGDEKVAEHWGSAWDKAKRLIDVLYS